MPTQPRKPADTNAKTFSMRAEAGRAEILLYDVIDNWYGISAKQFHDELKALGEVSVIDLRINSPGGSITEGMAIYSILRRQTAKIVAHIDGIAASMASVVAMAAGEIVMAAGSYMMIHNPLGMAAGEAGELRDLADLLDKMKGQLVNIYAARTKKSAADVADLMDAETWFTADEAIAAGFADRISPELSLAASLDASRFLNVPQQLRGEAQMSDTTTTNTATPPAIPQAAAYDELKADCIGADAAFLCSQLEKKATLAQARAAWMTEQQTRLAAANQAAEDAKGKLAAAGSGVKPLGGGSSNDAGTAGDPIARFNELLAAKMTAGMKRAKAVSAVIAENPELHDEYLAAYNAARKSK